MNVAFCVACGCDDWHTGPTDYAAFVRMDRAAGLGLCRRCATPEREERWDHGERTYPEERRRAPNGP